MTEERKSQLATLIGNQLERLRIATDKAVDTARKYKNASRSEEGDRAHAENSAEVMKQAVMQMELLLREVETSTTEPREVVECPSFVSFVTDRERVALLAKSSCHIDTLTVISPESPLGKVLLGKKAGDTFQYDVHGRMIAGTIKRID
jgi:transcription elongation GreA/GreB family factor